MGEIVFVIYSLFNIFISAVDFCRPTARPIRFVVGLALNIYYYDNDDDYRSVMSQVKTCHINQKNSARSARSIVLYPTLKTVTLPVIPTVS